MSVSKRSFIEGRGMSHLYVMQNHLGLIKIGRSASVEARRKAIEATHKCSIILVGVIKNAGDREEAVHQALDDHRCLGEWFDGTAQARQDVIIETGLDPTTIWPVALADEEPVDSWLNALSDRMLLTSRDKAIQKVIREIGTESSFTPDPDQRYEEGKLYITYWRSIRGRNAIIDVGYATGGGTIHTGFREGDDGVAMEEPLPEYLTDMDAALSLWPDYLRPSAWQGSAWECCIAALKAHKALLANSIGHRA